MPFYQRSLENFLCKFVGTCNKVVLVFSLLLECVGGWWNAWVAVGYARTQQSVKNGT